MKTIDLLTKIEKTKIITEREMLLLKNRMNKGEKIDTSVLWDNEIELTPEHNKKGIDFLLNQYKTPKGIERKNNPFGYREIETLENFTHFELRGFYDAGNCYRSFYLPLYVCCGGGSGFE